MDASQSVREAAVQAEPWLRRLARLGYVAKGVIYGMIGVLGMMAAAGIGGKKTNQAGAINSLATLPFGRGLLLAIGVGLLGYALWRFAEAAFDPEEKGAIKRIGYVISGLAYGGFGWGALSVALAGDRAESHPQRTAATLLSLPYGPLLGHVVAVIFAATAVGQIVNGIKMNFTACLKTEEMSGDQLGVAKWTGRLGLIARGCLFGLIAWLLWRASADRDPREAGGVESALATVAKAPSGPLLLALMSAGLICYGVWMIVEARFRRMVPVTEDAPSNEARFRGPQGGKAHPSC